MHLTFGQINEYHSQTGRAQKSLEHIFYVSVVCFSLASVVALIRCAIQCIVILKCQTIEMYADESGRH